MWGWARSERLRARSRRHGRSGWRRRGDRRRGDRHGFRLDHRQWQRRWQRRHRSVRRRRWRRRVRRRDHPLRGAVVVHRHHLRRQRGRGGARPRAPGAPQGLPTGRRMQHPATPRTKPRSTSAAAAAAAPTGRSSSTRVVAAAGAFRARYAATPWRRATAETRESASTGLGRCSWKPAASARCESSAPSAKAVRASAGVRPPRSGSSWRT